MGRISTAFRAFFQALFRAETAARLEQALAGRALPPPGPPAVPPAPARVSTPAPKPPAQSEAITLLAALQREARLVDFLQEDLTGYADEQIGAAVREIQRDSQQLLERFFALRPIYAAAEGDAVDLAPSHAAGKVRLSGKVTETPPAQGTLQHHGWEATRCELPGYTGSTSAARIIAPAEVEIG